MLSKVTDANKELGRLKNQRLELKTSKHRYIYEAWGVGPDGPSSVKNYDNKVYKPNYRDIGRKSSENLVASIDVRNTPFSRLPEGAKQVYIDKVEKGLASVHNGGKEAAKFLKKFGFKIGMGALAFHQIATTDLLPFPTKAAQYTNSPGGTPVYEVNDNVLAFLNLDDVSIQANLKVLDKTNGMPEICNFYKKLHEKIFNGYKFVKSTCAPNISTTVKHENGSTVTHDFKLNDRKKLQKISVVNTRGMNMFDANLSSDDEKIMSYKLYRSGKKKYTAMVSMEDLAGAKNLELLKTPNYYMGSIKLFSKDLINCCNDGQSNDCTERFKIGSHPPAPRTGTKTRRSRH